MEVGKIMGMVALALCVGLLAFSIWHLATSPMEEQNRAAFLYKWGSALVLAVIGIVIIYFMR
jgi:hypothetical protein